MTWHEEEPVMDECGTTMHVTVRDDDGNVVERRAYSTITIPPPADGAFNGAFVSRLRIGAWRPEPRLSQRPVGNNRKARRAQAALDRGRR